MPSFAPLEQPMSLKQLQQRFENRRIIIRASERKLVKLHEQHKRAKDKYDIIKMKLSKDNDDDLENELAEAVELVAETAADIQDAMLAYQAHHDVVDKLMDQIEKLEEQEELEDRNRDNSEKDEEVEDENPEEAARSNDVSVAEVAEETKALDESNLSRSSSVDYIHHGFDLSGEAEPIVSCKAFECIDVNWSMFGEVMKRMSCMANASNKFKNTNILDPHDDDDDDAANGGVKA